MAKFSGKGAAGKLADWLNKVLAGSLSKYIHGSRGIEVQQSGDKGVTISTVGAVPATFLLSEHKQAGVTLAKFIAPGGTVDGDAVDQDLYFTYSPGFYFSGQQVVAWNIMGQWEVLSQPPGDHLEGTLDEDLFVDNEADVVITGTFAATVTAHNTYALTGDEGEIVGVEWNPNRQQFVITAIKCPTTDSLADGGAPEGGGDSEDGGTPQAAGGNLDGGTP